MGRNSGAATSAVLAAGPTAMSQIQKMTAQATAITAAMTISLTRQRRFGFFASAWVDAWFDAWEAGVAFCDIGGPSVVGRGMSSPSDWTRALRRNSTPYAGTNRIRFEGLLSTLSASVALPCRLGFLVRTVLVRVGTQVRL